MIRNTVQLPAISEEITNSGKPVPGELTNEELLLLGPVKLELVPHGPGLVQEGAVAGVLHGVRLDGNQTQRVVVDGSPHPGGQITVRELETGIDVFLIDSREKWLSFVHTWVLLPSKIFLSKNRINMPITITTINTVHRVLR